MSEHTCDGTWRWYCEPCSGLPQDLDPWSETQDESPFRLAPADWHAAELRKAKAEAWDEALQSFAGQVDEVQSMWIEGVPNPYRTKEDQ